MDGMRRSALLGALILALVAAPTAGFAAGDEETGITSEAGLGALAAVSTLIYGPVKIVYATLGLLVGGTAWCLSGGDTQVFDSVITASVRGDYVVTPAHLRMERSLEFYGREPQYRAVASAPPAAAFGSEDY